MSVWVAHSKLGDQLGCGSEKGEGRGCGAWCVVRGAWCVQPLFGCERGRLFWASSRATAFASARLSCWGSRRSLRRTATPPASASRSRFASLSESECIELNIHAHCILVLCVLLASSLSQTVRSYIVGHAGCCCLFWRGRGAGGAWVGMWG